MKTLYCLLVAGLVLTASVSAASSNAGTNDLIANPSWGTNPLIFPIIGTNFPPVNPPLPGFPIYVTPNPAKWTYVLTNTPSVGGTNAAIWSEGQFALDKSGNGAVLINLFDTSTNYFGYNLLWISSKGHLLQTQSGTNTPPMILSVSGSSLYVSGCTIASPEEPYAVTQYTVNNTSGNPVGTDADGVLTSGEMKPAISSFGYIGRSTNGGTNSFRCYLYENQ